ncbi:pyridoxal phosphate-dependent decarboxylase family protein [Mangrovimonas aestuarii]|uniref:pyridoxal phosphate-dependent decarboxylase family protein n=1 Tax=Mangrovimonas aestuarii TaxID=3018443 RepID=UPI0023787615|nr:pyridoxal-dependent decarboxylase [Mangrovimonas aestuarii]
MSSRRKAPINLDVQEFKTIGYNLVDALSELLETIYIKKVTLGETPKEIKEILGDESLPEHGISAELILSRAQEMLLEHSLFNGHPRFLGYITSSQAPIGILADLLASGVNANCGANILSPMATAIETQTVNWLAELIGLPNTYGGVLVSGGNMANFTGFLAGRTQKASKLFKSSGLKNESKEMVLYCSKTTHTWVEKAAVLFGHGSNAIRWVDTHENRKMNISILERLIKEDIENGKVPFMVVGTAGDVSTGIVDDLGSIGKICEKYKLWFHVDGAYGVPAAIVPEEKEKFKGLEMADSIALDPHKWLYSPLEAGCTLVKNSKHLSDTFSSHPEYYNFDSDEADPSVNYYEYGLQNSRGFRALKVWAAIKQVGKHGYIDMIREDINLAKMFFDQANEHQELEAISHNLSITTLRYVPLNLAEQYKATGFLNDLNQKLLNVLQKEGEVFLSNAIINGTYCLRGCIVNFRTSEEDISNIIQIIVEKGQRVYSDLKS